MQNYYKPILKRKGIVAEVEDKLAAKEESDNDTTIKEEENLSEEDAED
ncbi:MAG: hypothetical protein IJA10_09320 [Lachnospiraceae bacterium]|nr:hypothetical protein [Lachnospiraceae bacterium]